MLIDQETEQRIMRILQAVSSSVSVYLIGKELGQSTLQALSSALTTRRLTFLEQSFLAGKVAQSIGTDKLKTMTEASLRDWIVENNVTLSDTERATLAQMRNDTERWLEGRSASWQQNFRTAIANADRDWRATIAAGSFTDAQARSVARNGALAELIENLRDNSGSFESDVDRLIQTEMHAYFQQGQVVGVGGDEYVYKIPRMGACPHCMRLHLKSDGSPKLYRLKDVIGNSNWGKRAYSWKFTIGPVHPHCYCVLYRVSDKTPPGANLDFATARKTTLRKSIDEETALLTAECDVPANPEILFEDVLSKSAGKEQMPEHQVRLVAALRDIYGDEIPKG